MNPGKDRLEGICSFLGCENARGVILSASLYCCQPWTELPQIIKDPIFESKAIRLKLKSDRNKFNTCFAGRGFVWGVVVLERGL